MARKLDPFQFSSNSLEKEIWEGQEARMLIWTNFDSFAITYLI